PVSTPPTFGGLRNGFATSMKMNILTKIGPPGTGVRTTHPTMETLKQRIEKKRTYYVAGHLLNNNLHGPGTTWKNLAPITQRANRNHLKFAEKEIKQGVNKGWVYRYEVTVNYGRSLNQSLFDHFNSPSNPDSLKNKKAQVVQAEQYIPTSFGASWQKLDRSGKPEDSPRQTRIDNKIDERPENYKVK
nr:DNA/RNA non-specific endonuclease [Desulfocapsaceae bacterium]